MKRSIWIYCAFLFFTSCNFHSKKENDLILKIDKIECVNKKLVIGNYPKIDTINFDTYKICKLSDTILKVETDKINLKSRKITLENSYTFRVLFDSDTATENLIILDANDNILLRFNKQISLSFVGCNFIENNPHYFFRLNNNHNYKYFQIYTSKKSKYTFLKFYRIYNEFQRTL